MTLQELADELLLLIEGEERERRACQYGDDWREWPVISARIIRMRNAHRMLRTVLDPAGLLREQMPEAPARVISGLVLEGIFDLMGVLDAPDQRFVNIRNFGAQAVAVIREAIDRLANEERREVENCWRNGRNLIDPDARRPGYEALHEYGYAYNLARRERERVRALSE